MYHACLSMVYMYPPYEYGCVERNVPFKWGKTAFCPLLQKFLHTRTRTCICHWNSTGSCNMSMWICITVCVCVNVCVCHYTRAGGEGIAEGRQRPAEVPMPEGTSRGNRTAPASDEYVNNGCPFDNCQLYNIRISTV